MVDFTMLFFIFKVNNVIQTLTLFAMQIFSVRFFTNSPLFNVSGIHVQYSIYPVAQSSAIINY